MKNPPGFCARVAREEIELTAYQIYVERDGAQ
jgi:hypothetical protein